MAKRISRATGLWSNNNTWGLVDTGSFSNSESTANALTTAYQLSTTFTLAGPTTIDGHAMKLAVRTGTLGTVTTAIDSASIDVPGTVVAVSASDLPAAATADLNGGWIFFKYATPITLSGSGVYSVKAKASNTLQVSFFVNGGSNWDRILSTTTTGTPAAADDVIIAGEYTGVGTSNNIVVTMDNSGSTIFGSRTASLLSPAIAVCSKAALRYDTGSSTTPTLKLSGSLIVYSGGEFSMGSTGSEIPRNSSASLQFMCKTNVDYGLEVRNLGTYYSYGLSRTAGKNVTYCKLTADVVKSGSVFNVDTDTGWLHGDMIGISSTSQTKTESETGSLSGSAGATSFTVNNFLGPTGSVIFTHSGSAPFQAEVINLTRNVKLYGSSSTQQAYINVAATATASMYWTEYQYLGSATTNKRGINTATTTGQFTMSYCALHDFKVASSCGLLIAGTSGNGYVFSNNVTYLIANSHFQNAATTNTTWLVDSCVSMLNTDFVSLYTFSDLGGTVNNLMLSGCQNAAGIILSETNYINSISNINVHSCQNGLQTSPSFGVVGTINNLTAWRCISTGVGICQGDITINNLISFGINQTHIDQSGTGGFRLILNNPILNGDILYPTGTGINLNAQKNNIILEIYNGLIGVASGSMTTHTTDIQAPGSNLGNIISVTLVNTKLGSATEVSNQTTMTSGSYISSQKHDQIAGQHKTWKKFGTLLIDSGSVHTGTKSLKMIPNDISCSLESSGKFGGFKVAVASGSTITPTVYVMEDTAYNGRRATLIAKRNDAIGWSSDYVLATATAASDGAWEALTGTTSGSNDDGTAEFVITCTGTTGSLYVDSFSVT